ncbi:MAG TPA: ankyrin repeat domain-containing protein, partial [Burkholderiales bacterium]|nr:ankyrin repeat domain-containing protein [Burkholderiales bacterium]
LLLERGADPDAVNLDGNLALHGAADAGREDTVKLLLPRTRDPALRNLKGKSPRDLASERGFDALAAELP